ncbi:hypothetical protein TgHK011_008092 [Trichoderma gracile]|nr:hypothetical protein TgHK011_008092 [Trichoderma gracile]
MVALPLSARDPFRGEEDAKPQNPKPGENGQLFTPHFCLSSCLFACPLGIPESMAGKRGAQASQANNQPRAIHSDFWSVGKKGGAIRSGPG